MRKSEQEKILKRIRDRRDMAERAESENRKAAIDDLKFRNGEQWAEEEKRRRQKTKRAMLTVNLMGQYIDQVINDWRQTKAQITVAPATSKTAPRIAKITEGIISDIQYQSNAESIYDEALSMAVTCGYGGFRIETRYKPGTFDQEIIMVPCPNPFAIMIDPTAKDPVGSDAEWGFFLSKYSKEEFEDKWPKAKSPEKEFAGWKTQGFSAEHWFGKHEVTVAEYFEKVYETKTIYQLESGEVVDEPAEGVVKTREERVGKWKHYIVTGAEVLDGPKDLPFAFLPLIPVYGKRLNIEGKTHIYGLLRFAKDPARLHNYWITASAELIALAPKAPWQATAKQIGNYLPDYLDANKDNIPILLYDPDPEAGSAMPIRTPPASVPTAIFAEIERAERSIAAAIGMRGPSVGQNSGEVSGTQTSMLIRESDNGMFDFGDNLARAITHAGKVIISAIPKIYDTEGEARVRNIDETEGYTLINMPASKALETIQKNPERFKGMDLRPLLQMIQEGRDNEIYNDLSEGQFNTRVKLGPSHSTARENSAKSLLQLAQYWPKLLDLNGDILLSNMDFMGNDEAARRVRKTMPPGLVQPRPGEDNTPLPPPPQMLLLQERIKQEQAKTQANLASIKTQQIKGVVEAEKLKSKSSDTDAAIRTTVLQILQEVLAPVGAHPIDQQLLSQA